MKTSGSKLDMIPESITELNDTLNGVDDSF